jgi:hypothetical protein
LKPIREIQVGDWVLSRSEYPAHGGGNSYKRVTRVIRFESKVVVNFVWFRHDGNGKGEFGEIFLTPGSLVWSHPQGWMPVERVPYASSCPSEWFGRNLVMADDCVGEKYELNDLYRTDKPEMAFQTTEDWGGGMLVDLSESPHKWLDEETEYDYANWGGDLANDTRDDYATTVYGLEVEDSHSFFVGKTGLWVHDASFPAS